MTLCVVRSVHVGVVWLLQGRPPWRHPMVTLYMTRALKRVVAASLTGSLINRVIGRCNVVEVVRMVATLTSPSGPGWSTSTRASGHFNGGTSPSVRSTRSPTLRASPTCNHFARCCNWWRTSLCHLRQTCWRICVTRRHRGTPVGSSPVEGGSGGEVKAAPMRKCPSVRARVRAQRAECSWVQTRFDGGCESWKLFKSWFGVADDSPKVVLKWLDHWLPQTPEVWGSWGDEGPLHTICLNCLFNLLAKARCFLEQTA